MSTVISLIFKIFIVIFAKLDIIMWEVCILSDLGNKEIMSKNLKRYIELSGKDRKDIAKDLNVSYSTFTDWVNGNYYPKIDNIEKMANYFNITKADLVEEQNPLRGLGSLLTLRDNDKRIEIIKEILTMTDEQQDKLIPVIKLIKSNLL